ncbi:ABC-2 type transporter [Acetobacteraceae bacterium AT-5844]|nr:ABC-2 type transporter [Acetobacteraceae bacterium AT-5844]
MSGNVPQRRRDGGLAAQLRVLQALVIREMLGRFGQSRVGYIWLVGEPVMLAVGISTIHWLSDRGLPNNIPTFLFYGLGYAAFFMFRAVVTRCAGAINGNLNLLYHRSISLHDLIIARTLVEFVAVVPVILLFILGGLLYADVWPAYPGLFALSLVLSALLGHGVGALLAALIVLYEPLERIVHPLTYLMMPLSAAFAMVDSMPPAAQEIILKNPLAHVNEAIRYAQWGDKIIAHYDLSFVTFWVIIFNFMGMVALRAVRSRISMAH